MNPDSPPAPDAPEAMPPDACGAGPTPPKIVLMEGFEDCKTDAVTDCPKWLRVAAGRELQLTSTWVHMGQKNLALSSFTMNGGTSLIHARLPLAEPPARVGISLVYTPSGQGMTYELVKDFAEFGLASLSPASEYDLTPIFSVKGQDHKLFFDAAPGRPQPGERARGEIAFGSLDFAQPGATAPIHTYVYIELDFCDGVANIHAGTTSPPAFRKQLPISKGKAGSFDALYIAGGAPNVTYIDNVTVEVLGPRQ